MEGRRGHLGKESIVLWLWVIPSWSGYEHGLWSQKAWFELPVFDSLNQLCDISTIALSL